VNQASRFGTPEGVNQASRFGTPEGVDGRFNRTRVTQDASAVCKETTTDAEGSDANSHAW
jgi:hypothetical protein